MVNTQLWLTKTTLQLEIWIKSWLTSYNKPINIQAWQQKRFEKLPCLPFKNIAKPFLMPLQLLLLFSDSIKQATHKTNKVSNS